MSDTQSAKFEGWAVVELFGHQKEVGFVTTQYFGGAALLQIDVPELPEREVVMKRASWAGDVLVPAGAIVTKSAVPGRTRLVGPSAIYALNPCTEAVAREALEENAPREIAIISFPQGKQIASGDDASFEPDSDDEYDDDLGDES
ncbi:MAG TPA: hypothetical protein VM554_13040 [Acidisarcina sp.]|nr:hypothetical protein [Acidisarcina sp.]